MERAIALQKVNSERLESSKEDTGKLQNQNALSQTRDKEGLSVNTASRLSEWVSIDNPVRQLGYH